MKRFILKRKQVLKKMNQIPSKIKSRYRELKKKRICQGDILKDLKFVVSKPDYITKENTITLLYAVVLSQECDLERDFIDRNKLELEKETKKNTEKEELLKPKYDKMLPTILICPAYPVSKLCRGEHIKNYQMETIDYDKLIRNDRLKRYHYLHPSDEYPIPELAIDFKHFFSLPRDLIYENYKKLYITTFSELFREELSQRFTNYLSRIGLPQNVT